MQVIANYNRWCVAVVHTATESTKAYSTAQAQEHLLLDDTITDSDDADDDGDEESNSDDDDDDDEDCDENPSYDAVCSPFCSVVMTILLSISNQSSTFALAILDVMWLLFCCWDSLAPASYCVTTSWLTGLGLAQNMLAYIPCD